MSSARRASSFGCIVTTETIPETGQAPRLQELWGVSRARKGLQLESAPHGARRRTGTVLTRKGLPDRAGALERFPSPSRHHPHSLFRHHCRPPATGHPSPRSQKPAHVTSARGAAPSAASAVSRGRGAGSPPAGLAACGYPIYPNESALFLSTQLFLFL